jgi:hypothetical protein
MAGWMGGWVVGQMDGWMDTSTCFDHHQADTFCVIAVLYCRFIVHCSKAWLKN